MHAAVRDLCVNGLSDTTKGVDGVDRLRRTNDVPLVAPRGGVEGVSGYVRARWAYLLPWIFIVRPL
jgi:hypothetical protein